MSDAPSQSQDKFIVRLPDGMRERIKEAAAKNNRSMNAEIVRALELYLSAGQWPGRDQRPPPTQEAIDRLMKAVAEFERKAAGEP